VFKPSGGKRAPIRATMLAFFISGVVHEYLFDIGLGRIHGFQMAFFLLQGVAVAATVRIKPIGWRIVPWVVGTLAFNLTTGVLFFASVDSVLPFYARGRPLFWRVGS